MIRIKIEYDFAVTLSNIYLDSDKYTEIERIEKIKELTKDLYDYKDNIDYVIDVTSVYNNTYLDIYECTQVNEIPYKRTWCDYLTKCNHFVDEEVGSYECCCCCPFHVGCEENEGKKFDPCDYSRYSEVITGIVKCKYNG